MTILFYFYVNYIAQFFYDFLIFIIISQAVIFFSSHIGNFSLLRDSHVFLPLTTTVVGLN